MIDVAGIFLIRRDNKFLVGHPTNNSPNTWGIPKGHVGAAETPIHAAIRETYEETNVDVDDWKIIHHLPSVDYKSRKKRLFPFVLFESQNPINFNKFELKCNSYVEDKNGDFPEMDDFKWVTLDESRECIHETQIACLDKIQELINKIEKK